MRIRVIGRQISTYVKITTRIFTLALTVSDILMFQMFKIENLGQGHRVQHSQ